VIRIGDDPRHTVDHTQPEEIPEMTLDQTKVGQVVAAQMEALEEAYGEDCESGDVCTIVEVIGPHGSDVRVRSSDLRPHVSIGLLRMAESIFLASLRAGSDGEGG
jgi:hypothetical protein